MKPSKALKSSLLPDSLIWRPSVATDPALPSTWLVAHSAGTVSGCLRGEAVSHSLSHYRGFLRRRPAGRGPLLRTHCMHPVSSPPAALHTLGRPCSHSRAGGTAPRGLMCPVPSCLFSRSYISEICAYLSSPTVHHDLPGTVFSILVSFKMTASLRIHLSSVLRKRPKPKRPERSGHMLPVIKEKDCQLWILDPAEIPVRNEGKIKKSRDEGKRRSFVVCKCPGREWPKEIF